MYVSEATQFIESLKAAKPTLEAEQRRGRAIWWDKEPVPLSEQQKLRDARVPQQAYVYQTKG